MEFGKSRKILTAILAVLCLVCVALAAACAERVNYYLLTCVDVDGMEYSFLSDGGKIAVMSGAKVKEGYVVRFKPEYEGRLEGEPVFKANSEILSADGDGIYSFTMNSDVKLSAEGFTVIPSYEISFSKGVDSDGREGRVSFFIDGEPVESLTVEKYEDVSFTVEVSSYYKDTYTILSNTAELTPVAGVYTLKNVTGKITVSAYNLETDDPFSVRPDGGNGSRVSPFKISKPIDLYLFANIINDSYHLGNYGGLYYELTNDIDMQGEQLYVIGDMTSSSSYFYGNFNGNGHTISNFRIEDYIIEQENYTRIKLPYLGLFGLAAYGNGRSAEIYNLHIKDFTIDADISGEKNFELNAGGIVGYGIGATISGCSVEGDITIKTGENFAAAGGIIGIQQSYADATSNYYSSVASCHTDVEITASSGGTGYVSAAGGIAGMLVAYEKRTPAYIINCYTEGAVRRVLNGGGIVGYMREGTSVGNAYSVGRVNAVQAAGGIAGIAENDTVISDCFSYAIIAADSNITSPAAAYVTDKGTPYIEGEAALVRNCHPLSGEEVTPDDDFFKNTLHWEEEDWKFTGGYPTLNFDEAHKTYSVTLNFGPYKVNGSSSAAASATDVYASVAYWNAANEAFPEFITADNGYRSYGYFFDEGLSEKVPFSYVPARNVNLYVGFADYASRAGTYYIEGEEDAFLRLSADGTLLYRNGALVYTSYFTYDGENALFYDTVLSRLATETPYHTFKVNFTESGIEIYDNEIFKEENALRAKAEYADFAYGVYYGADGTTYTYRKDGTLVVSGSDKVYKFTVSGTQITVEGAPQLAAVIADGEVVQINGNAVSRLDMFEGVWEKSATSNKQFAFDGKGGWRYKYFGYNSDGSEVELATASGTYEIGENGASLKNSSGAVVGTASEDGSFLLINYNGHAEVYYKQFSYTGIWRFFNYAENEPVQLELMGIGTEDYGKAVLNYASSVTLNATYAVEEEDGVNYISVYVDDTEFCKLSFNKGVGTLSGSIYSIFLGKMRNDAVFCLFDDFEGEWVSNHEILSLVRFNGLGSYDLKGNAAHAAVRGLIWIEGRQAGTYMFENSVMKGGFTYKGVQYTLEYDELNGKVVVTYADGEEDKTVILEERDDWFGNDLVDGDGSVYSFDGRGNLSDGGKMTQTVAGQDVINVYTYKITETGLTITGENGATGTITEAEGYFLFDIGGKQLTYANEFGGEWLLGGEYSYTKSGNEFVRATMTIGKITPALKAAGTFLGKAMEYTYDKEGKLLSFVYGGETLYVSASDGELYVGFDKTFEEYFVCIKDGEQDGVMGVYTAADGFLIFDGLGDSSYGSGSAFLVNGDGLTAEMYGYTYNERGLLIMIDTADRRFAFVERENGKYTAADGKKYDVMLTRLYEIHAVDTEDEEKTYVFDGVDKLYCSDGKVYTYDSTNIESDELNQVYTIRLADGKIAELDYSTYTVGEDGNAYYKLTIKEAK